MKKNQVKLSKAFIKNANKSLLAIILFLFTYLILVLSAVLLTYLSVYGGILLIRLYTSHITFLAGIGLMAVGFFVLFFLIKFIFSYKKENHNQLIEISRISEPKLFETIDDLVKSIGVSQPKKVFLSADVNASVNYTSSFFSMFFPVRKNLTIGMPLINTLSIEEFKAVLAHEFGHFGQSTMRIGVYVSYINRVLYNMLYENESYDAFINSCLKFNKYISAFLILAVKINEGIQWILKKQFYWINQSNFALSREMEFHADAISADAVGYQAMQNALLRMYLADEAYNKVCNFYYSQNSLPKNIFKDQYDLMLHLAKNQGIEIKHSLPYPQVEDIYKNVTSKINIKDQWASHPTLIERLTNLEASGCSKAEDIFTLANHLLSNAENLQELLTQSIFYDLQIDPQSVSEQTEGLNDFIHRYNDFQIANNYPTIFNGYYDFRSPNFKLDTLDDLALNDTENLETLFNADKLDWVQKQNTLLNDLQVLNQIDSGDIQVKTFEYDGVKYNNEDSSKLTEVLKGELDDIQMLLQNNDKNIYQYFANLDQESNKPTKYETIYKEFNYLDQRFSELFELYSDIYEKINFTQIETPFDEIETNLIYLLPLEIKLKAAIKWLIADVQIQKEYTEIMKNTFEKYINETLVYFEDSKYIDENLNILCSSVYNFGHLLIWKFNTLKWNLVQYQATLVADQKAVLRNN